MLGFMAPGLHGRTKIESRIIGLCWIVFPHRCKNMNSGGDVLVVVAVTVVVIAVEVVIIAVAAAAAVMATAVAAALIPSLSTPPPLTQQTHTP
jgi:uncharacterized membrane protein